MRQCSAITIALIRNPAGEDWQGQIQIEHKNVPGKMALNISGDNPMQIIERAKNALAQKFTKDGASQ